MKIQTINGVVEEKYITPNTLRNHLLFAIEERVGQTEGYNSEIDDEDDFVYLVWDSLDNSSYMIDNSPLGLSIRKLRTCSEDFYKFYLYLVDYLYESPLFDIEPLDPPIGELIKVCHSCEIVEGNRQALKVDFWYNHRDSRINIDIK